MAKRRQRRRSEKQQRHAARKRGALAARDVQIADRVVRLAYTRKQAAEALGVSLATLDRRVVPAITTVGTEWGARLIPVAELERYLAERRREPRAERQALRPGRKPGLPPKVISRIRSEHAKGGSLGEIARGLNFEGVPTSQGGRQWWPSTVRAVLARSRSPTPS
jgi:Recombinase